MRSSCIDNAGVSSRKIGASSIIFLHHPIRLVLSHYTILHDLFPRCLHLIKTIHELNSGHFEAKVSNRGSIKDGDISHQGYCQCCFPIAGRPPITINSPFSIRM